MIGSNYFDLISLLFLLGVSTFAFVFQFVQFFFHK